MEFVIVTGMSGSGKSTAVKVLEDIGYFCIDNMPPQLVPNFAEICSENGDIHKVAIVTDIRGGAMFSGLRDCVSALKNTDGINVRLLFLEATPETLIKRYSETRRLHPLNEAADGNLEKAIEMEQGQLWDIRSHADYIIDSSLITTAQLKEQIAGLFMDRPTDRMIITCMSFGFKFGIPNDADLVFDVRCLPNPFYVPELKRKTGLDADVREYVMNSEQSQTLENKIRDMVDFLLPMYIHEGKSRLVIAFGCTGGKHRSITFAKRTADYLSEKECKVREVHRDIEKK